MSEPSRIDPTDFEDPLSDYEPVEYASELRRALAEETVDAIQVKPFVSILPATTIREAVELLHQSGASSLLVVDHERLVGIFTERDVLERVVECYDRLADMPVSEVMTANPTVVYETDPAAAAVAAIGVAGHRHVPVLCVDDTVLGSLGPRRVLRFMEDHCEG